MTSTNKNSNDSAAAAAKTSPTTTAYQTIEDLIGPTLYVKQPKKPSPAATDNDGVEYTIVSCTTQSVLTKKKKPVEYVLLYFSASWCPPCQSFTPILADFYQRYPDQMEIIYISSDRNVTEFTKYYTSKMELFSTIHPFDATASDVTTTLRKQLPHVFQISGIPTLVVLHMASSEPGIRFVTDQGRMDLLNHQNQLDTVWTKWKSSSSSSRPLLSIEEGVALSKRGDGSIGSIIWKLLGTLAQNPIYIVGIFYLVRFYGKSIYQMIATTTTNSTAANAMTDPAMFEPIPEDEF